MTDRTLVYFAQAFAGGPIKIGRSARPADRIRSLQAGSPAPLDLVCVIPGGEQTERTLHEIFADGRLHGEWFDETTPGLAAVIEQLLCPDRELVAVLSQAWREHRNQSPPRDLAVVPGIGSETKGL